VNPVGRSLKRIVSSDAAYRILDRHPGIAGGTWNQGGCWVLAEALRRVLGDDAELWAVMTARGPSSGFVQHVVVKWHGKFYDADGESTERALLLRWRDEELLADPYLEPFEESRTSEETVCPMDAVRDAMEMLAGKLVPNADRLAENPAGTFTLYHGSHTRFDKPTEFRQSRGGVDYGPGFYMTTDPREAAEYGRYVYVATVKLENPLDLLEDDPEALKKLQRGLRIADEDLEHADNKTLEALRLANFVYSQKGIRNLLMRLGYDGIYADHRLVEHPRTDVASDFVSVLSLEQILSWELLGPEDAVE
jgi:hypothetical protein